jgi:hypothetical protein
MLSVVYVTCLGIYPPVQSHRNADDEEEEDGDGERVASGSGMPEADNFAGKMRAKVLAQRQKHGSSPPAKVIHFPAQFRQFCSLLFPSVLVPFFLSDHLDLPVNKPFN